MMMGLQQIPGHGAKGTAEEDRSDRDGGKAEDREDGLIEEVWYVASLRLTVTGLASAERPRRLSCSCSSMARPSRAAC